MGEWTLDRIAIGGCWSTTPSWHGNAAPRKVSFVPARDLFSSIAHNDAEPSKRFPQTSSGNSRMVAIFHRALQRRCREPCNEFCTTVAVEHHSGFCLCQSVNSRKVSFWNATVVGFQARCAELRSTWRRMASAYVDQEDQCFSRFLCLPLVYAVSVLHVLCLLAQVVQPLKEKHTLGVKYCHIMSLFGL